MTSKDFHSFQRPQMDMTTCIAHGFHVFLALSEPFQKKDSSWCAELVSHSLHCIGHCTDLRSADIYLQADNTCREVKNNTLTRLCGLLSGLHRVHSITLNFLTTGHSHEDVDQFFSAVTNYLQKDENQELHTPDAFIASLQRWLDDPQIRPYERHRFVRKVDAVRAWLHDCALYNTSRCCCFYFFAVVLYYILSPFTFSQDDIETLKVLTVFNLISHWVLFDKSVVARCVQ